MMKMILINKLKNILNPRQKESVRNLKRNFIFYLWKLFSPFKKNIDPNNIKRVLIISRGVIGDLIIITPMIKALYEKYGTVDVLVRPSMYDILSENPNIHQLLVYESFEKTLNTIKDKYNLAIIFWPHDYEMKKLCKQAKIDYTIGNGFSTSFSDFFLSQRPKEVSNQHFLQKALDQAALSHAEIKNPKTEFYIPKSEDVFINNLLKKNKIKKFAIIHSGKRGDVKRFFWPSENFARIADFLIKTYNLSIILTGSENESERINEIINHSKFKNKLFNFCNKTNLKQFASLIKKTEILISINTGATHIASAFNTKTIVLNEEFPKIWHPWMPKKNYRILQQPQVDEVKKAITELI